MFKKAKQPEPTPVVPAARVNAIAARLAPADYCETTVRSMRSARAVMAKRAIARTADGEELPVVIRNLSSSGLRVEYSSERPLGDRVLIVEPSLPLRAWAQVVWQGAGAGGLQIVEEAKD